MEKGIKAWIANAEGDAHIDIPGGWHWDISRKGTGFLAMPDGKLCVGYDLKNETIQFGKNGETEAPGLNLWTIQEMGEKFAREHFMDEKTAKEYDEFATERGNIRKEHERGVRNFMTGTIQIELREGQWTAHVDTENVKSMVGLDVEDELTREEGVALFNKMSEMKHVMPLRDPMGYMTLENNVYNYIKDQYDEQYNKTIDDIESGLINGNGRGCLAVLGIDAHTGDVIPGKLDSNVRKNIREYCLPDGVNYQDLRHIELTPEIGKAVDEFVKQRVIKTVNFEKKRDHKPEGLAKDNERFLQAGSNLRDKIAAAALPPMNVSLENDDMKIE